VDGSINIYTYGPLDERITINYRDRPCRINTYGNSFTQCHQVSDGETWQEILAAHLQEPIRNFGVGGWSVYQAYLRMLKEEERAPADYIVFNIYEDDHFRNLDAWRNIRVKKHERFIEPTLPHLAVNLRERTVAERPNPCPTPESVYDLCDLDWVVDTFQDDFVLQIMLAHEHARTANPQWAYQSAMRLATTHGIVTRIDTADHLSVAADGLHRAAATFSSERVVDMIETFARAKRKRLLFILSYSASTIARFVASGARADQPFVDFMRRRAAPCVDLLTAHADDFSRFKGSIDEYLAQYFIGHYNPRGNSFCASAVKDRIVDLLEPKPAPYRLQDDAP
jgi:hypothetical protein